jgi:hypothetical protein
VPIAGQFFGAGSEILPVRSFREENGWRIAATNIGDFETGFYAGVVCLHIEPAGRLTTASKGNPGR